ncbi:MAG: hypothetical protein LBV72_08350 [Tannerella sp.]|nr:hypothetical protein [Tannerella sp.]
MKRNFTLSTKTNAEQKNSAKAGRKSLRPGEDTLNFIRQFARVYQFEPTLDQGLCSYIVN